MSAVVVIPVYKPQLDRFEKISLRQCLNVLGNHTIVIAGPDDMEYDAYLTAGTLHFELFPSEYFRSIKDYNRLLVSPHFYERFADFGHMLLCQLDAFVFRDELDKWCALGYSYIGSPWFEGFDTSADSEKLWAVGNGGFSLRKISDHLEVLRSTRRVLNWAEINQLYRHYPIGKRIIRWPKMIARALGYRNSTKYIPEIFGENEDRFWSFYAKGLYKEYSVAPLKKALQFSFECNPQKMYELNGGQLPFGCHAWGKHDLDFWRPFINEAGHQL